MATAKKPVLHYFDLGSLGRGEVVRYVTFSHMNTRSSLLTQKPQLVSKGASY